MYTIGNWFRVTNISGHWQCVLCCAGVIRIKKASSVHTEEMKQPVSQLPAVLEQSLALSNARKYKSTFKRWQEWASTQRSLSMPADPLHISLYLVREINDSMSPASVSDALHSIAWMHQISGHVDTCKTDIVKRVHQAALRHLACPRQRKTPLSKKVLKNLGKLLTTSKLFFYKKPFSTSMMRDNGVTKP